MLLVLLFTYNININTHLEITDNDVATYGIIISLIDIINLFFLNP
jgi:hypothetical protein